MTTLDDFERNVAAADAEEAGATEEEIIEILRPVPVADLSPAVARAASRTLDDIGNAERVRDLHGNEVRFIGDEEQWAVWDGARWGIDINGGANEVAKKVAESMAREQLRALREAAGEEPAYPESYPAIRTKGKRKGEVIPPDEWLADEVEGDKAIEWIFGDASRAQWYRSWLTWAKDAQAACALREFAGKCRDMGRLRSMMQAAESLPTIAAVRNSFDRPYSGIFVTTSGTIDTRTGQLREHRQTDWNTRLCPVAYEEGAASPLWTKFLERNLPDPDTRRYIQKLAGYSITGDADQKLMVLLHSDVGDTGKSLLLNTLKETMGPDYAAGLAQSTLAPRRDGGDGGRDPDRHQMLGKRLLIGSEFRKSEPMDEAFMKRYTGRDPISSRGNNAKRNIEWTPEGLIVIGTNKLFRIDLDDPAVWARIVVVPFTVSFPKGHPERDDDLQRKILESEKAGVLAWIVEGLRMYREEGLVPSAEITMATENYRSNSDHVKKWIEAAAEAGTIRLTDEKNVGSVLSSLWDRFESWKKQERLVTDLKQSTFKARLAELGYPYAQVTSGSAKGHRLVMGIELTGAMDNRWIGSGGY
jgi:putative DNA primase/helicase